MAVGKADFAWRPITGLTFSPRFLRELQREYEVTHEIALNRRSLPRPDCGAVRDAKVSRVSRVYGERRDMMRETEKEIGPK